MAIKREEKALREFKQIIEDVVSLLHKASGVETVYLHWVNRSRRQFVHEAHSTTLENVIFQDRTEFEKHFLNDFKDTREILDVEVGMDEIDTHHLTHYYDDVPIRYITIIPFINNNETVALTVMDSIHPPGFDNRDEIIGRYKRSLMNVLNTYLELTDLYEKQHEWTSYDEGLNQLSPRLHKVEILQRTMASMQSLLPSGGVCLIARGMGVWTNIMVSENAVEAPVLGLMIDEKSIAYDALQKGEPEFAIHFNQNPKRLSSVESSTEGATIAIPLLLDDRRHAVIVAYDKNGLVFKQSVNHQLVNLVRIAGLAIRINLGKLPVDQDLLTSSYGSFIPDVWERVLETEIRREKNSERNTWFGIISIENIQILRSRYRLNELKRLQRTLVKALNPSLFGAHGYIGFNSDYVFTFIIQGQDRSEPDKWIESIQKILSRPVKLNDGREIPVQIKVGYTKVNPEFRDAYEILEKAKEALSRAGKESEYVHFQE